MRNEKATTPEDMDGRLEFWIPAKHVQGLKDHVARVEKPGGNVRMYQLQAIMFQKDEEGDLRATPMKPDRLLKTSVYFDRDEYLHHFEAAKTHLIEKAKKH